MELSSTLYLSTAFEWLRVLLVKISAAVSPEVFMILAFCCV
jgi:hypothetical protein